MQLGGNIWHNNISWNKWTSHLDITGSVTSSKTLQKHLPVDKQGTGVTNLAGLDTFS